jgi:hypothetical protein
LQQVFLTIITVQISQAIILFPKIGKLAHHKNLKLKLLKQLQTIVFWQIHPKFMQMQLLQEHSLLQTMLFNHLNPRITNAWSVKIRIQLL